MKTLRLAMIALAVLGITVSASAQHPEMSSYNGAESCYMCHSGGLKFDAKQHAMDIMQTAHYKFKGWGKDVYDDQGNHMLGEENGKWTRYCGLPGSVVSINWLGNFFDGTVPGGCSRCHISNAEYNPDQGAADPDEAWKRIDCMLCHSATYKVNGTEITAAGKRLAYTRESDGKKLLPYPSGDDLKVSSSSITKVPTAEACSRCHSYNGGGYTFKRGLDYLVDDLHYEKGLTCTQCHYTDKHKIAFSRPDPALVGRDQMSEEDLNRNRCVHCHTAEPHEGASAMLNAHVAKIDCSTCHVPFHKGMTNKRFDMPVKVMKNGSFVQWTFKLDLLEPTRPHYKWWNETVDHVHVKPLGSISDGKSKIYPFKLTRAYVPKDKATGIYIPLKLGMVFGSPESATEEEMQAKIDASIRTGAKLTAARFGFPLDGDGNYTAEYEWEWHDMWGQPGHGTVRDGLTCTNCHTQDAVLPYEELGYTSERANELRGLLTSADGPALPEILSLGKVYPNPANGVATVSFTLPSEGLVTVKIFDTAGRLVKLVTDGTHVRGRHTARFGTDGINAGLYFYQLSFRGTVQTRKMVVMK